MKGGDNPANVYDSFNRLVESWENNNWTKKL